MKQGMSMHEPCEARREAGTPGMTCIKHALGRLTSFKTCGIQGGWVKQVCLCIAFGYCLWHLSMSEGVVFVW